MSLVAGGLGLFAAGCGDPAPDSTGTSQPAGGQGNQVITDVNAKPVSGGKVAYGLEAESDGFNPVKNRWAISGVMVGLAVFDPLAAYNDKSEAKPYLAESFTPNAAYTEWTVKLRPDIKFSNGTPLTAEGVKAVYEGHLLSPLTKPVFSPVKSITVKDPLSVVFTMSSPWVVFPSTLTAQTGVIPEPSTLEDNGAKPIGTGPFVQVDWVQGSKWIGKKNPTYWRKDKDGTQLPYLNEIEFRPIIERDTRNKALLSNDIQMMHANAFDNIKLMRDEAKKGTVQVVEDTGEGEEGFVILNSSKPPFDDVDARRALAHATNAPGYGDFVNENVLEVASSVFRTNSAWYAPTKNYPEYDVVKARELIDKYKASHGGQAPKFTFGVSGDTAKEAQYLLQGWQEVGFDVEIKQYEQASFISDAVFGNYQANLWRQFGAPDPDADLLWWTSANAGKGDGSTEITLNIARHKSACKDDALKRGREKPDLAERKKAYADLQQCMADEVPYVWLDHSLWIVAASPKVRDITNGPLPDGSKSLPIGGAGDFGGVTRLTQVWLAP